MAKRDNEKLLDRDILMHAERFVDRLGIDDASAVLRVPVDALFALLHEGHVRLKYRRRIEEYFESCPQLGPKALEAEAPDGGLRPYYEAGSPGNPGNTLAHHVSATSVGRIAREAGVSPASLQRALNGEPVRAATRQRLDQFIANYNRSHVVPEGDP